MKCTFYIIIRYLAALYKNGDIELPAALAEDLPPSAKKARTEVRRLLLPSSYGGIARASI